MSPQSLFGAISRVTRARDRSIAIVGALVLVLLLLQSGIGHSLLSAAGVSRPSASYVELYFTNARYIPTALPKSDRLDVRFAVVNVSTTTRTISWQITEKRGNAPLVLFSGSSVVRANRTNVISENVHVQCSGDRAQLSVATRDSTARITLWLACRSRR